jgi:hypothetical protein
MPVPGESHEDVGQNQHQNSPYSLHNAKISKNARKDANNFLTGNKFFAIFADIKHLNHDSSSLFRQ